MTGVQIIIVRLETLLLAFREPSLLSSNIPPRLFNRPHPSRPRFDLSFSLSLSFSLFPRASFRRDVSQSKRFCNASMIYCTCRDLTSGNLKGGCDSYGHSSPPFSSFPISSDRATEGSSRRIRERAGLPRNLYPPFRDPTSFIPLDLAGIRSSFNPFDFYTRGRWGEG